MNLLEVGALERGRTRDSIHLIRGEAEATEAALNHAMPGDLIVITPSEVEACWKQVNSFEPKRTAVMSLPRLTVVA